MAFGFTPFDRSACRALIERHRYDGPFTPPTTAGSIQYPINMGGAKWGSVSIDPGRGRLYVNMTRIAGGIEMIPRAEYDALDTKESVWPYQLMPMLGAPYAVRLAPLLSPLGAPCSPPPWGSLTAVDLATGSVVWESTLGNSRHQAPFPIWMLPGIRDLGTPNLGGSITTASGLVFIGGGTDGYLRAFDAEDGEVLWSQHLPYTVNATPMSFRLRKDGRQFVVIASGGHAWSPAGDMLVAFALPD
jgi:quinoprotein glucose dehydrogenase